jgi:flavin-dependent dehydrogenase
MWDVIVVGARCAGAALALRFARSGRTVLVLEKAPTGSDTLSTHALLAPGVRQVAGLGLLDEVRAVGAPQLHKMVFAFGGAAYAHLSNPEPPGYSLSIRRTLLDPILQQGAERAGATFRFQSQVEGLLWEDGRVVGVQGRDHAGHAFAERARLVVGADGRHSSVARWVSAPEYHPAESRTGVFYGYLESVGPTPVGADAIMLASGPGCDSLCIPCDGGLHVAILILGLAEFERFSAADTAAYEARLRTIPALAPRLEGARLAGKLRRAGPDETRCYFRQPYGPGWALVGDAGHRPHPSTATGISVALRSTELLHQAVHQAWTNGQAAEDCLGNYQQTRDAECMEPYFLSIAMSQLNPFADPRVAAGATAGAQQVA